VAVVSCLLSLSLNTDGAAIDAATAEDESPEMVVERLRDSYTWTAKVSARLLWEGLPTESGPDYWVTGDFAFRNDHGERMFWGGRLSFMDPATGRPRERNNFSDIHEVLYVKQGSPVAYQYAGRTDDSSAGAVFLHEEDQTLHLTDPLNCTTLLGHCFPFSFDTIPDLLASTPPTSFAEEEVAGVACYRIEARLEAGEITVWVAPSLGYTLQKCVTIKEAEKDRGADGEPFHRLTGRDAEYVTRETFTIDNVQVEQIEDKFVCTSAEYSSKIELSDGEVDFERYRYRLSDIDFDPTFDNTSFALSAPEGTDVQVISSEGNRVGGFEWHDGRAVAAMDVESIEAIKQTVEKLKGFGADGQAGVTTVVTRDETLRQRVQSSSNRILLMIAVFSFVAISLILWALKRGSLNRHDMR